MYRVRIQRDLCKGCGFCVKFCPKNLLKMDTELNKRGVHPAIYAGVPEDCIGCASCAVMCPDAAIEIDDVPEDQ